MAFRPGNHDKAWNDPPVFSYQSTISSDTSKTGDNSSLLNTSKKTVLNKRVAFPLSHDSTPEPTQGMSLKLGNPPPVLPLLPPSVVPVSCKPSTDISDLSTADMGEELEASSHKVLNTLNTFVIECVESDRQGDFIKRIQILQSNWEEGKLNKDIRTKLEMLCECLNVKDFTKAENIQVSLAVDYTADCASWILVIKNIIAEIRKSC